MVLVDHFNFHAAVAPQASLLGFTLGADAIGLRRGLTEATHFRLTGYFDAFATEVRSNGVRTLLAEAEVVGLGTDLIGEANDADSRNVLRLEALREGVQFGLRSRGQRRAVEVEVDGAHFAGQRGAVARFRIPFGEYAVTELGNDRATASGGDIILGDKSCTCRCRHEQHACGCQNRRCLENFHDDFLRAMNL